MAEEIDDKVDEKEKDTIEETTSPEVAALATKLGWNPDYAGGDREFVTAEDYILRSKEIQDTQVKQNKSLKLKLSEFESGLKALKKHNEAVYQAQVAQLKSEISKLRSERKEAVVDEDTERVTEIDDRISELKKVPEEMPKDFEPSPVFRQWVETNDWYLEDDELKQYAEVQAQSNPKYQGLSEKRFYETMTKDVRSMFPEKFGPAPKQEPKKTVAAVEGASRRQQKTKFTVRDLTESQRKHMKFFEENDVMTGEAYIKELEQSGELA